MMAYPGNIFAQRIEIKRNVRQQVDFVDDDQLSRMKNIGILERLVIALRDTDDGCPHRLPQVKQCRAYQIADIFNKQQTFISGSECFQRSVDHFCIEVTTLARVDLDYRHARRGNPVGIIGCLLIALDDAAGYIRAQLPQGAFQQRCFARARGTHEVERNHIFGFEVPPVALRQPVILAQYLLFEPDDISILPCHLQQQFACRLHSLLVSVMVMMIVMAPGQMAVICLLLVMAVIPMLMMVMMMAPGQMAVIRLLLVMAVIPMLMMVMMMATGQMAVIRLLLVVAVIPMLMVVMVMAPGQMAVICLLLVMAVIPMLMMVMMPLPGTGTGFQDRLLIIYTHQLN